MKFFISAFIAGIILSLLFPSYDAGSAVYPEFTGSVASPESTAISPFASEEKSVFSFRTGRGIFRLTGSGKITFFPVEGLFSCSGNGKYWISYEKAGSSVEFFGEGQRFWKQKSREYPLLSGNGRLIFMMNGDQSAVRILDLNGNETGTGVIAGRICTSAVFSPEGDWGAAGFLDGSFTAVRPDGTAAVSGFVKNGGIVKGLALSPSGKFLAVHGGDSVSDSLEIIDTSDGSSALLRLKNVHNTRTAMYVTDEGTAAFLDKNMLVTVNRKGNAEHVLPLEEKRSGHASVLENGGRWFLGYTALSGVSEFLVMNKDGNTVFSRKYPGEAFLDLMKSRDMILVRGSDNIYCYSFIR